MDSNVEHLFTMRSMNTDCFKLKSVTSGVIDYSSCVTSNSSSKLHLRPMRAKFLCVKINILLLARSFVTGPKLGIKDKKL